MSEVIWRKYVRTGHAEMRPYVPGEDMSGVSVSDVDNREVFGNGGGMVARNLKNHSDQWYIAKKYFEDNFTEVHYDSKLR